MVFTQLFLIPRVTKSIQINGCQIKKVGCIESKGTKWLSNMNLTNTQLKYANIQ